MVKQNHSYNFSIILAPSTKYIFLYPKKEVSQLSLVFPMNLFHPKPRSWKETNEFLIATLAFIKLIFETLGKD